MVNRERLSEKRMVLAQLFLFIFYGNSLAILNNKTGRNKLPVFCLLNFQGPIR
jgi:hypothetical protein